MNHIPVKDLYTSIDNELKEHGIDFRVLHADHMWGDVYYVSVRDNSLSHMNKSMWLSLEVTPQKIHIDHIKRGDHTKDDPYTEYKHPRYFKKYMHIVRIVHEVIKQKHKEVNQHG